MVFHELYNSLTDVKSTTFYKQAFLDGNQEQIWSTTKEIQELVQNVYDIGIETKYSDPELSKAANGITDKFNEYVEWYNRFINSPDRMSDEYQKYACVADKLFGEFVDLVVKNFDV